MRSGTAIRIPSPHIFFKLSQKHIISWTSADEKEKAFIEDVTRVSYERDKALREGHPLSKGRPAIASYQSAPGVDFTRRR